MTNKPWKDTTYAEALLGDDTEVTRIPHRVHPAGFRMPAAVVLNEKDRFMVTAWGDSKRLIYVLPGGIVAPDPDPAERCPYAIDPAELARMFKEDENGD